SIFHITNWTSEYPKPAVSLIMRKGWHFPFHNRSFFNGQKLEYSVGVISENKLFYRKNCDKLPTVSWVVLR
ncbi:MAG: hypothetical protein COT43_07730, partial [Candidatus Marinimicrobia bacterium CG08_land_8_20_14_0_20_45_22]